MKKKLLRILPAMTCAASLLFVQTSLAQNPRKLGPGGPGGFGYHQPPPFPPPVSSGTSLSGTNSNLPPVTPPTKTHANDPFSSNTNLEALNLRIALTELSGSASGIVNLHVIDLNGTVSGGLDIRATGLAAGIYTVSATFTSGSSSTTLGTFTIAQNSLAVSGTAGKSFRAGKGGCQLDFGSGSGIQLPSGLNAFDIATLTVSDANSNALLSANLSTATDGSFIAQLPFTAATGITATGSVNVQAHIENGSVIGSLCINATGLTANATYSLSIDGVSIGTATADASGTLKLLAVSSTNGGTLPSGAIALPSTINLFNVTTLSLSDSTPAVILSVNVL